jgi:hypothetical protein
MEPTPKRVWELMRMHCKYCNTKLVTGFGCKYYEGVQARVCKHEDCPIIGKR